MLAKQGDRTLPLPEVVGARRLVEFAREADGHDKRWTPVAVAVDGAGITALVGTPEQIAASILDYYDLAVSSSAGSTPSTTVSNASATSLRSFAPRWRAGIGMARRREA